MDSLGPHSTHLCCSHSLKNRPAAGKPGCHAHSAFLGSERESPPEGQVLLFKSDQGGDRKKARLRTLGRDSMADADFTS